MLVDTYRLSLQPGIKQLRVKLSQYDVGETINFKLFHTATSADISSGITAEINGTKSNGEGFTHPVSYSYSSGVGTISFAIADDMANVAGDVYCKITLTKGTGNSQSLLSTASFVLEIEKAAYSSSIPSYTVTFKNDDGAVIPVNGNDTQKVTYGANAIRPANPKHSSDKAYYIFTGWSPSPYNVTENRTCIAEYALLEILDTWPQILANESNGTYSSKYAVGSVKKITINDMDYLAQIVAFDADPLSDNSGNAKITWVLEELYADDHRMNVAATNTNGWPDTEMRSWLNDTILPLFPSDVRAEIKEVTKTSYDKTTSADVTSNDKLWIPSAREVFTSFYYRYESSGPTYTPISSSNSTRIKYKGTSTIIWWLRSANSSGTSSFQCVSGNGYSSYRNTNDSNGVCIGFCT